MRVVKHFGAHVLDLLPNWEEIKGMILVILVVSSGMFLSGCVIVRADNLHLQETWPPANSIREKAINLSVTAKASDGTRTSPSVVQSLESQSQKAYTESGLFERINLTTEPTDFRAEIEYIEEPDRGLSRASGFLFGLILGMIPAVVKQDIISVTTFRDRAGKELGSIRQSETVSVWMHLFLLFAMPFREGPQSTARSVYYDLNRATLEQAHMQGIL